MGRSPSMHQDIAVEGQIYRIWVVFVRRGGRDWPGRAGSLRFQHSPGHCSQNDQRDADQPNSKST